MLPPEGVLGAPPVSAAVGACGAVELPSLRGVSPAVLPGLGSVTPRPSHLPYCCRLRGERSRSLSCTRSSPTRPADRPLAGPSRLGHHQHLLSSWHAARPSGEGGWGSSCRRDPEADWQRVRVCTENRSSPRGSGKVPVRLERRYTFQRGDYRFCGGDPAPCRGKRPIPVPGRAQQRSAARRHPPGLERARPPPEPRQADLPRPRSGALHQSVTGRSGRGW